jgi:cytochrome c556
LHEVAEVSSLAAAMAKIDRSYDLLKLCRVVEWSVPSEHPDVVPAQEALQVKEGLHQATRTLSDDFDEQFKSWLALAESRAEAVEAALRAGAASDATRQFQFLEQSCKQCHSKYRN